MIAQQPPMSEAVSPGIDTDRCPATAVYWAVLDVPIRRPGPLSPALLLDVQDQVPVSVQELHAVGVPLNSKVDSGPGSTLVCAVPRETLRRVPASVTRLTPDEPPPGYEDCFDLHDLNLLVGEFEPLVFRRRRALRHMAMMVGVIVVALVVSIGLHRRTGALNQELTQLNSSAPPQALSRADLAMLRAFVTKAGAEPVPADATAALAAVLRAWPTGAGGQVAEVQSLNVDSRRVALTVNIGGDPADFLAHIHAPPGYVVEQPGIGSASEGKVRIALTFARSPAAAGQAVRGDEP